MKHVKGYIKDYPRPQFVRNDYQIIHGAWKFKFDFYDEGLRNKWYLNLFTDQKIIIPYSYQTKLSQIHIDKACEVVWYEKEVTIHTTKQTILHLDGSDYHTQIWVNGQFIGEAFGGYHRISFDISNALKKQDTQKIVMRIKDTHQTIQPRGKQRWKDENFGCWYVETTGIWKSVWLEYVHPNHLKHVILEPKIESMMLNLNLEFSQIKTNMMLEVIIMFEDEIVGQSKTTIFRNFLNVGIDIKTNEDQFKLKMWSMEVPNLYDIIYRLYDGADLIDEVFSYTGFKKLYTKAQGIYLNDMPIYLKMLLDQGYYENGDLTPENEEAILNDILLTQQMGFNGIRKHQKIEDERFYYYCDILGILVWLEMPSSYELNHESIAIFTDQWLKILKQYRHYTSIMAYVLFNESWGIPHISTDYMAQQLSVGLYYLTKSIDPHKLVISNDGWEHTKSDIITIHHYASDGDTLKAVYKDLNLLLNHGYHHTYNMRSIFSHGYTYENQPIMISEFGGIALSKDHGWGYGEKVSDESALINRLTSLIKTIKSFKEVCGYCLTQTTDVQQEVNGLLNINRKPKVDIEIIRKLNEM